MFEFRPLTEEDWVVFKPLDRGCYPDDYLTKKLYDQYIKSKGFIGFFRDKELIGYMFLQTIHLYGHLNRIAVRCDEQNKGYGTIMMSYALDYFRKRRVKKIGLYVETKNKPAMSLYKKFGFDLSQELWFYKLDEDDVKKIEETESKIEDGTIRKLTLGDFYSIFITFPSTDKIEMEKTLEDSRNLVLGLFVEKELKAYGIFDPRYSGCRSIKCTKIKYFDEFISRLKNYRVKNYYHISFDTNKQLADLCDQRGYTSKRHLWKMERKLEEV